MEKLFNTVGVSTLNGDVKVRFANGLAGRVKVLERNGHKDIRLVSTGDVALSKLAGVKFLQAHADFQDALAQGAISSWLAKREPKPAETAAVEQPAQEAPVAQEEAPAAPVAEEPKPARAKRNKKALQAA